MVTRTENDPHDDLTGLANQLISHLHTLPGGEGVKAVIMLSDGTHAGTGLSGWDEDIDAVSHVFLVMKSVMKANGMELRFVTLNDI